MHSLLTRTCSLFIDVGPFVSRTHCEARIVCICTRLQCA